jgi:glycosyltransferase involved in cell wall biosynthesis
MVYPTRFHRRLELGKMRRVLGRADIAVMNTTEAARLASAAFPELVGRLRAIPNAYDPADFDGPPPTRADRRFRIVHTGSFHMDLGERHRHVSFFRRAAGGYVPGVDFLSRSHVFLVEALRRLFAARTDLRGLVELHCAGVLTEAERRSLEQFDGVRLHGFLPHDQTTALIRTADLLFLPMHDLASGRRATIVPQKTYEYLAAGRPILAAVPDGDARDLLGQAGTARLCRPSDVDDMTRIIAAEIDDWGRGEKPPPPAPELLARCAAPQLATAMADVFDELLARRAG